jgi:hypothetical protein
MAGFEKRIKGNLSIIYAIVPERVPVTVTIENETRLMGFKYRHYLRIIDLVSSNDQKSHISTLENFQSHIMSDPDKWNPFI